MDESTQQAIQFGVNITIFIVALSISITLLMGVRDVSEKVFEYDATIPTGSRVFSAETETRRKIGGDEILSYFSNYMIDKNNEISRKYIITIENLSGNKSIVMQTDTANEITGNLKDRNGNNINYTTQNLKSYLLNNGINLNSNYEILTNKYDSEKQILFMTLKEVS